jgi:hypothetical protein
MPATYNADPQNKPTSSTATQAKALPAGQYSTNNPVGAVPAAGSNLAFPYDLQKQPFWMSFSFYQYNMPSLTQQNVYYADQGTIRLPLPNGMVDSQQVQYDIENLSLLSGAAINQLQQGNVKTAAGLGVGSALFSGALSKAASTPEAAAFGALNGVAANPFLTVMFKQPAFKKHALEWKLTPSNEQESLQLNAIINTFRANMLPDVDNALGGSLLTYPNIVQIQVSVNDPNYFTYVFKPAVVESFDVNFAPSGQPSFFGSSASPAPTEVQIRLGIMEIEYWLSSDYGLQGNQVSLQSLGSGFLNLVKSAF